MQLIIIFKIPLFRIFLLLFLMTYCCNKFIKCASGVLVAARFPLARLRSAGGFKLRREFGLMTKKDC